MNALTQNRNLAMKKKILNRFILWTSLHLFALVTSYASINIFNREAKPKTGEFWPFTSFHWHSPFAYSGDKGLFNGIFANYDWSEFVVYVGAGALIAYFANSSKEENAN